MFGFITPEIFNENETEELLWEVMMLVTHKVYVSTASRVQVGGEISNPEPRQLIAELLKVVPDGNVILILAPTGRMFLF